MYTHIINNKYKILKAFSMVLIITIINNVNYTVEQEI